VNVSCGFSAHLLWDHLFWSKVYLLLIRLSELPKEQEVKFNGGRASGNKAEDVFSV
jgi:hypothetical protein